MWKNVLNIEKYFSANFGDPFESLGTSDNEWYINVFYDCLQTNLPYPIQTSHQGLHSISWSSSYDINPPLAVKAGKEKNMMQSATILKAVVRIKSNR